MGGSTAPTVPFVLSQLSRQDTLRNCRGLPGGPLLTCTDTGPAQKASLEMGVSTVRGLGREDARCQEKCASMRQFPLLVIGVDTAGTSYLPNPKAAGSESCQRRGG